MVGKNGTILRYYSASMDLTWPYSWNDRKVLLKDRVLYVPDQLENYEAFQLPDLDSPDIFGNANPVHIEYCSGNGAWIIEKARLNPGINWIAIEMKFDRVRKIWKKSRDLPNLFIIYGEGLLSSRCYIPTLSIAEVYINFPDPWPKKRHWKNRIVQAPFVKELERMLQPGGFFNFVTDDAPYSEAVISEMAQHSVFLSCYKEPDFATECNGYGSSYFEELWRQKGKQIRYHRYQKCY